MKEIDLSKFHVLTMISNPVRYSSRYRLYEKFKAHLDLAGIRLWTCEVAFGDRPFEVTQPGDHRDLQLRTSAELWHKERALNLLAWHLTEVHPDWRYLAWLDADIEFPNWHGDKAWFKETVHALQHYRVVQLFQNAIDLGPNGECLHTHTGFGYSHVVGRKPTPGYSNQHPGFCWAIRRQAFEDMGGFIDFAVLGSGDRHMALGWINQIHASLNHKCASPYWRKLMDWQSQAERYIRRDIGFVPGMILHHWHGKKRDRGYQDRWKILTDLQFDPDRDIKPDAQGLWQLVDHGDCRSIQLRDRLKSYFRSRNEDSIDLE